MTGSGAFAARLRVVVPPSDGSAEERRRLG